MQTLSAWLKLFPAILSAVRGLEDAIPLPAVGKAKLDLLLTVIKTAYDSEQVISKEIPWERLASVVTTAVKVIVEGLNTLGVFHRSQATTP